MTTAFLPCCNDCPHKTLSDLFCRWHDGAGTHEELHRLFADIQAIADRIKINEKLQADAEADRKAVEHICRTPSHSGMPD